MKAINIKCESCKAEPGEKCRDVGYGDDPRNAGGFHVSRARRAHYQTIAEKRARRSVPS